MTDAIKDWLGKCPRPVIARVIDNVYDLNNLLNTECVYEDNVLVVIDLKEIARQVESDTGDFFET